MPRATPWACGTTGEMQKAGAQSKIVFPASSWEIPDTRPYLVYR